MNQPAVGALGAKDPFTMPTKLTLKILTLLVGIGLFSTPTFAQDAVTLAEILPALEGSELGEVVVADAPAPGAVRRVRRSHVLAALARDGRDARGLDIPRVTTIRRVPVTLDEDALRERALPLIAEALAPCEVIEARLPRSLRLPAGRPEFTVEARAPTRTGRASGVLIARVGGTERRLAFSVRLSCPAPAVSSGSRIRLVTQVGSVIASAPGEASQSGRIGDVIRVRTIRGRRAMLARVIDSDTVELVR